MLQQPLTDSTLGRVTIDMLPDNGLLEIFYFYKNDFSNQVDFTWRWDRLTRVCRRWRYVVFGSPRRLELRLVCTNTTPTSRLLDIWPPFPIIIFILSQVPMVDTNGVENIIAPLERRDRISRVIIQDIGGPALEKLVTVLREPLPILTTFSLNSTDQSAPVLPENFLAGSATCLRSFRLAGIPFPSNPQIHFTFHSHL
jgi:hypothetical protein